MSKDKSVKGTKKVAKSGSKEKVVSDYKSEGKSTKNAALDPFAAKNDPKKKA